MIVAQTNHLLGCDTQLDKFVRKLGNNFLL